MIEIEKPRIETAELTEDGKYGKFVVEPPHWRAVLSHPSRLTAFFTNFQRFRASRKT